MIESKGWKWEIVSEDIEEMPGGGRNLYSFYFRQRAGAFVRIFSYSNGVLTEPTQNQSKGEQSDG